MTILSKIDTLDYYKSFNKKKYKLNEDIEFSPVYFNSLAKTIINNRFKLENAFQKILYRIDAWINNGSGWIIESIKW